MLLKSGGVGCLCLQTFYIVHFNLGIFGKFSSEKVTRDHQMVLSAVIVPLDSSADVRVS